MSWVWSGATLQLLQLENLFAAILANEVDGAVAQCSITLQALKTPAV